MFCRMSRQSMSLWTNYDGRWGEISTALGQDHICVLLPVPCEANCCSPSFLMGFKTNASICSGLQTMPEVFVILCLQRYLIWQRSYNWGSHLIECSVCHDHSPGYIWIFQWQDWWIKWGYDVDHHFAYFSLLWVYYFLPFHLRQYYFLFPIFAGGEGHFQLRPCAHTTWNSWAFPFPSVWILQARVLNPFGERNREFLQTLWSCKVLLLGNLIGDLFQYMGSEFES